MAQLETIDCGCVIVGVEVTVGMFTAAVSCFLLLPSGKMLSRISTDHGNF